MKVFSLILLCFILGSCSTPQSSGQVLDADVNVVDIDAKVRKKISPKINNNLNVSGVGPEDSSLNRNSNSGAKSKVWALILSPGLNRVICHAVAVKALYEKGVKFNVFTGTGMGAVVAAMLASEITPEIIEWKFHKFFQKSKGMKPFSKEWMTQVKEELLKGFVGKKIQGTKLTLIVPVYNNEERKVEYLRRGDLHVKLLENLKLSKGKEVKYSSTLEKGFVSASRLKNIGVEKIVALNVLGKKIKFEKSEDLLIGIFGKLSAKMNELNEMKEFDHQLNLPIEDFALDATSNLPGHLRTSYLFLRDTWTEADED